MKSWFVRFLPFILITTFIVIAVPVVLYTFHPYSFTPVTINKSLSNLSPAGDLTGTWVGAAFFRNPNTTHYCTFSGNLTLKLTQSDNKINGQFVYTMNKGTPSDEDTRCELTTDTFQISANVSSSRIENLETEYGTFEGAFTKDTITLNQSKSADLKLVGPINLRRQ